MQWQKGNYSITTDQSTFSIEYIHQYLSVQSYWAQDIPLSTVKKSVENALSFGVFDNGKMVGFARVITDKATFAYLADVFIDEAARGKGLSKWLMEVIMNHPELQGLRRFMLATLDAHGLYSQYGFTAVTNPERLMVIARPDIYKNGQ